MTSSYPRSSSLKILKLVMADHFKIRKISVEINRCLFEMRLKTSVTYWFSYIVLKYKEKVEVIFGHSSTLRQCNTVSAT